MATHEHTARITENATQLFHQLARRYMDDRRTTHILGIWTGRVHESPTRHALQFVRGTMVVGSWCPNKDSLSRWRTRLITGVAKASVDDSLCAGTTAWLLQIATNELGWECDVDCDACYETGVCVKEDCPKCLWNIDNCAKNNKFVWPELIGRPAALASLILKTMHPQKRVILDPFDMLYQTPANPDVIRIVYDSRTGIVVPPAPYVTSSPEIAGPREACYLSPLGLCLGAPPNPPPKEWDALKGRRLGETIGWLQAQYPHAVIVPTPSNQVIPRDYRHDRIRVRYFQDTKLVSHTPTVG